MLGLIIGSFAFADTLTVFKRSAIGEGLVVVKLKDMKRIKGLKSLDNNEYFLVQGLITYKIKNKEYTTSMFEIEKED